MIYSFNDKRPSIIDLYNIETLDNNNVGISMTTKHDPYENAVAERVNGTLKNEFDLGDRKSPLV